jgi:hypothetical protein
MAKRRRGIAALRKVQMDEPASSQPYKSVEPSNYSSNQLPVSNSSLSKNGFQKRSALGQSYKPELDISGIH